MNNGWDRGLSLQERRERFRWMNFHHPALDVFDKFLARKREELERAEDEYQRVWEKNIYKDQVLRGRNLANDLAALVGWQEVYDVMEGARNPEDMLLRLRDRLLYARNKNSGHKELPPSKNDKNEKAQLYDAVKTIALENGGDKYVMMYNILAGKAPFDRTKVNEVLGGAELVRNLAASVVEAAELKREALREFLCAALDNIEGSKEGHNEIIHALLESLKEVNI